MKREKEVYLVKLNDAELIKKLLPLFLEASKDILNELQ